MKRVMLVLFAIVMLSFTACGGSDESSADVQQANQTRLMVSEAQRQVGMPGITNFQERKLVKMLYELRDQEDLLCYCYYVTMRGDMVFLGECLGYGIPASVQFSNPMRVVDTDAEFGIGGVGRIDSEIQLMPQPEPNGLFMPEGLAATYVMLLDPNGDARAVYVEPEIIISPFPLNATLVLTVPE